MTIYPGVIESAGSRTTGEQAQTFLLTGPGWEGEVPDGSTVMEMILPPGGPDANKGADKGKEKDKEKPKAPPGNTANAAKSILEQYMKRPRGSGRSESSSISPSCSSRLTAE